MDRESHIEDLYKTYNYRLLAFFLAKRLDRGRAEDFVQDVFIRYHKAEYKLDDTQARVALFKIARNVFFDHLRKVKSQRKSGISDEQLLELHPELDAADETADAEKALETKQELNDVIQKLESLPPKCREVFIDFRFRNLTQKEIAKRREISISMVEKHVANAVIKLKSFGKT